MWVEKILGATMKDGAPAGSWGGSLLFIGWGRKIFREQKKFVGRKDFGLTKDKGEPPASEAGALLFLPPTPINVRG